MLRVESTHDMLGFTEFEEEMILFDEDDPDFSNREVVAPISVPLIFKRDTKVLFSETRITLSSTRVAADMSLASVHPAELHSGRHSLAPLSHSLDDISTSCSWSASSPHQSGFQSDHVLTIEELRFQMTSCFTCGVSWADHHVSLDCSECGGYALERPCPKCEGVCGAVWKRDLTMSHASSKARWEGACNFSRPATQESSSVNNTSTTDGTVPTPQELCSRLENLSARS